MKPYTHILTSIDHDFEKALSVLRADPLFSSSQITYTDDDKKRIASIWKDILIPFLRLKKIVHSLYWRSFFTFGSQNSLVVKYACIVTYYNMVYELQQSFWPHEEFLRQYLDDVFLENYSTLARFMYRIRFYSILLYPREYFLTLRDEVDPSLLPLFYRPVRSAGMIDKRWAHDGMNIWYYIRYRIRLMLTWIAKYGGKLMMHIHLSRRTHGLIRLENIRKIELLLSPGDILLTRRNWAATNMNIPWFWKHMSMYIGTGGYLSEKFPSMKDIELQTHTHYIVEAIGVWVQIIPLDMLAGYNDYMWVIRPRFSEDKKQRAIEKTIALSGKSYDYSFNYYSDVHCVCSTLVTKAYLPDSALDEGIHITLTRIGISITYPPNDIVKKYHDEYETEERELDFVACIDSIDKTGENFLSTEEVFRHSGFRPKLSFFLP